MDEKKKEKILAKDVSSSTISKGTRYISQWYTWGPQLEPSIEQNKIIHQHMQTAYFYNQQN